MEAQVILKQGAVRRVGTGTTISITADPWLPSDDPYVRTDNESIRNNYVDSLMVPGQCMWDVEVIKDVFSDRDAQLILSIPLRSSDADRWFWKWEKTGQYSVKSAYAAIQDSRQSSAQLDNVPWKKLWSSKVPLKVKHFIWRAAKNVIPSKDQLRQRRVEISDRCPVCNNEAETVFHILVTCSFAKQCWNAARIHITENSASCFNTWLASAIQECNPAQLQEVFMICWSLWKNRNEVVWNQHGRECLEVCKSAKQMLNQWKNAQDKSFDPFLGFMTQEDGKEHWEYPQQGTVKINVDAAIFESSSSYCLSMIARDFKGDLLCATAKCREGSIAPDLAEALSIKEALSWIKTSLTRPAIVETDCLSVVQAIRCSAAYHSYFGRVIEECKSLISELHNRLVRLIFVKRSANKVAHFIARHNSSIADRLWSRDNLYPELHNVLIKDLIA